MPRGGVRPGAGAPRGNLNAVKHGRFSPRVLLMLLAFMRLPLFRELLIRQLQKDTKNQKRREYNRQISALARIIANHMVKSGGLHNSNNQPAPPSHI